MPNFFINVKEKGAKKAAGNIKSLTGSMKMMALQAVSVTAVVAGLRKSIQMSAEMEGVKRGFDNLAKSSGFSTAAFNKFKKATDGTVASIELMKQANNAMLLGITDSEDQMANLFDVAQRLGQSLGLDTVQAVESLVTGLGRQCLTSDSFVSTKDGIKQIIDIKEGDIVLSYKEGKIIETEVTHLHNNGIQPIYIVTFKDGKYIKSTDNHRYLTANGWQYLSELDSGTKILNIDNEYSEIHSINSFGEEEVYDLTVPETANFFANGLCVHNSKLMLDNLGIMVDTNAAYENHATAIGKSTSELTDQERKTAFVNAAMAEANGLVASLGDEQLTTKDKIAQMNTAFGDLAITLGDKLAPLVTGIAGTVANLVEAFARMGMTPLERMVGTLENLGADEGLVRALKIDIANEKLRELNNQMEMSEVQLKSQIAHHEKQIKLTQEDMVYWKENNMLNDDLLKKNEQWIQDDIAKIVHAQEQLDLLNQVKLLETEILLLKNQGIEVTEEQTVVQKSFTDQIKEYWSTSTEDQKKSVKEQSKVFVSNMQTMGKAFPEMEKAGKRAAQVQALVDTYASATAAYKAMAGIPVVGPGLGVAAAAAAIGAGLANVKQIEAAQYGMDEVVSSPTMIMAGEAGAEQVSITPLEGPNLEGPQGGGAVTVNVSGNLLSSEYVEGELAEAIREASRRGTDFGVS